MEEKDRKAKETRPEKETGALSNERRAGNEEKKRRGEYVKHYDLGGGRHQMVIYPEPVHYQKDGTHQGMAFRSDKRGCPLPEQHPSVSKKSTRCQENEYFIFLSCIIFLCRPYPSDGRLRVRPCGLLRSVLGPSRANALPPLSPLVTAGRRPRLRGWRPEDSALALRRAGTPGK